LISLTETHRKLILALSAFVGVALLSCAGCKRRVPVAAPIAVVEILDPWKEAVDKVEQDRGEAVGRNASVDVPEQLRHYADRRRFLAVQEADTQPIIGAIATDFAELVSLIQREELVEMKPLGADYILYGVGYSASGEPLCHYDAASRQDIPLAATEEALIEGVRQSLAAVNESTATVINLVAELRRAAKRDRIRRATLSKEVAQARMSLLSTQARYKLLAAFYSDPKRRKAMLAEHQLLSEMTRSLEGETYDLDDSDARRRFRIRLLNFIRPEARDVLIQIAHEYKEKFSRPLPVSSLVRPLQYQRELAGSNANAARGPAPPHSTGLAFDLYYRYMSAAEQEYLMSFIAHLKDEGRVEALRESRDNIHVYVFGKGRRPDEKLVAGLIASEKSRRPGRKTQPTALR
jgi:hypothetical protein